ncbi:MAG: pyruvate kinase alpha/beta domain-containing protein [Ruminococcus callidus]
MSCTVSERVQRQMNLSWGVYPMLVDEVANTDALFDSSIHAALRSDMVNKGDIVVITAGAPVGVSNTTNMMKVERI